jgi:hypothetical protein
MINVLPMTFFLARANQPQAKLARSTESGWKVAQTANEVKEFVAIMQNSAQLDSATAPQQLAFLPVVEPGILFGKRPRQGQPTS